MADITYQQVIELVKALPIDRLSSLYDFARFLRDNPFSLPGGSEDLFGENPDALATDEAWWNEQFERSGSQLLRLAEEAVDEYKAGTTTALEIDDQGRLRG